MPEVSGNAVVVGIGETRLGKFPGMNSQEIQAWAALEAIKDAGLELKDVDGFINLDPYQTPNSMFSTTVSEYLGLTPSFCTTVDVGGTVTGMTMLQQAVWAIDAGHCRNVVCVFGENPQTSRPPDTHGFMLKNALGGEEWEEPFGLQGMVMMYSLTAQRYMHETGATIEDFGAVAVSARQHALLNDNAVMKKPITLEDHRNSRMIASPLRLLDCSVVTDGGGALVLTSAEQSRRMGARAVRVRSMAMRGTHNSVANHPDLDKLGMWDAGKRCFEAAGIGPEDVDVAELHDAFSISVLLTLDALGITKYGEAGAFMRSGAGTLGGRCPVNTHGGLMSQGHVGGMLHLVEAVRQLRGEAERRQVEDARIALVSGNGGIFSICGAMLMERC
jgi:acetyl-CoA acetyltransferase